MMRQSDILAPFMEPTLDEANHWDDVRSFLASLPEHLRETAGPMDVRHPEANDLLCLINAPEILEAQTLASVRSALEESGYRETNDTAKITMNWAQLMNLCMRATIITADNAMVTIQLGKRGHYTINVHASDVNQKEARAGMRRYYSSLGKSRWIREVCADGSMRDLWGGLNLSEDRPVCEGSIRGEGKRLDGEHDPHQYCGHRGEAS